MIPAGNQTSILESNDEGAVQTTLYDIAADGRMNTLRTDTGPSKTDFLYDGRGYLREGLLTVTGSSDNLRVTPVYSSEGTLMARTEVRQYTGSAIGPDGEDQDFAQMSNETTQLFYFAGRPVAQLTSGPELLYLTTDHLGTPVLATDISGAAVWAGGVEPFGRIWTAGLDNPDPELAAGGSEPIGQATAPALGTLASEKVFLRYPGQWVSDAFRVTGRQEEIYNNVYRWYEAGAGRYSGPDPVRSALSSFTYVQAKPTIFIDPLGLVTTRAACDKCCDQFSKEVEFEKSAHWTTVNWTKYAWTPRRTFQGKSCLDSAILLQDDIEQFSSPSCWVTSVQLTKSPGSDLVKSLCGVYFPVHYVVKFEPCDGKGDDRFVDAYTGPDFGTLPAEVQIEEP